MTDTTPPIKGLYQLEIDEEAVLALARTIIERRFQPRTPITSAAAAKDHLIIALADDMREHFGVLFLDNSHSVLGYEVLFSGTINGAAVYSRDVVAKALSYKASAIIVAHNHPSGVQEPSRNDIRITERLRDALDTVDIRLLDHIIVAGTQAVSLADLGQMPVSRN